MKKHLVLGGVKSGKSLHAETLAKELSISLNQPVVYIATAQALDKEMERRIQHHKEVRPAEWETIEEPIYLANTIKELPADNIILIDCLTLWLTNLLMREDESFLREQVEAYENMLADIDCPLIMVSNEVNMGVIPMDALSRKFCDQAGKLHQRLAKQCTNVDLVVAGIPVLVKG